MRMDDLPCERRLGSSCWKPCGSTRRTIRTMNAIESVADDALNELFDQLAAETGGAAARNTVRALIRIFIGERLESTLDDEAD